MEELALPEADNESFDSETLAFDAVVAVVEGSFSFVAPESDSFSSFGGGGGGADPCSSAVKFASKSDWGVVMSNKWTKVSVILDHSASVNLEKLFSINC